jgi:hypothetical protein
MTSQLSENLTTLVITFNDSIRLASTTQSTTLSTALCTYLFRNPFLSSLGTSPQCKLEGKVITVSYGTSATAVLGTQVLF